jgi:hypothetical protein
MTTTTTSSSSADRLRALVAHAVAASPYYREVLGPDAASGDVSLQELPTLSKTTMMDNFDRVVTDRRLRRADLEAHLSTPAADRPYLGRYKLFTTAGTTGVRGLFVEGLDEFAVWIGTCLRGLASWGLGPSTRLAGIGSPSPRHITNQIYATLRADRLGHLCRRAQPAWPAVRPHRRRGRAQRRRRHPGGPRRRPGRGPSVPAPGTVLQAAGGPPVPDRPRPRRPARRGRAAPHGPGRHPGPSQGRPGRRAPRRRRGPAPRSRSPSFPGSSATPAMGPSSSSSSAPWAALSPARRCRVPA